MMIYYYCGAWVELAALMNIDFRKSQKSQRIVLRDMEFRFRPKISCDVSMPSASRSSKLVIHRLDRTDAERQKVVLRSWRKSFLAHPDRDTSFFRASTQTRKKKRFNACLHPMRLPSSSLSKYSRICYKVSNH